MIFKGLFELALALLLVFVMLLALRMGLMNRKDIVASRKRRGGPK
jgi:hypothetical protein